LSYADQASLLIGRGLIAEPALLELRLSQVNYYRLSGYLYPFRDPQSTSDAFLPGTTLEMVWRRYTFDRHLRFLVLDAIERIEVAIRSQLVYEHSCLHGPFGYTSPALMPRFHPTPQPRRGKQGTFKTSHAGLLKKINDQRGMSQEEFIRHYDATYGRQNPLPAWMAAEIMTFGAMLDFYEGTEVAVRQSVANRFGISTSVLDSWLNALRGVRNMCAHHGRLWNRVLGVRPRIPDKYKRPDWHYPVTISNDRVFGILTILRHMMRVVAPQSRWPHRLQQLLNEYPDIPRVAMGFPADWMDSPIWRQ
jgi:abortive infection bacteriophage resistance protein